MAYRVTNGAGTSFNTAANWDEGVNTPSIHASTSITVTSGGINSAVFTAPNLVNACTGVLVPVAARGTAGNIIAQLQHDIGAGFVDCALATSTIAITSLVASTHVFFEFGTAFVFATTTAGRYRVKLNTSGASGTTSIAADSGGANFAYIAMQNVNTVPTTGDNIFVVSPNQGTALTVSLDSSPSIGSGGNTAVPTFRSWQNAIVLANNGQLAWETATSRTVTCKGNVFIESGGWLQMGQTSAKIAAGVTARLAFDQDGTTTNYGMGHLLGGKITLQGADKTFKTTTFSSGLGTAASPLVVTDAVDWSVGDELILVPSSNNATNYLETEIRFIITKNSATSYVVSSTSGGAETALVYTHASGKIINATRQVLINTTNTSHAWYGDFNETTTIGNVDLDGCRLETIGSTATGKTTVIFSNGAAEICTLDDVVFYRILGVGITLGNNNDTRTYTHLNFYSSATSTFIISSLRNKTFNYCNFVAGGDSGTSLAATANAVFNYCGWYANSTVGTSGIRGAFTLVNQALATFNYCDSHANRSQGAYFSSGTEITFNSCNLGTKGYNGTADILLSADTVNTALFSNCLFGSTTLLNGYTGVAAGSEIAFDKFNQTTNDHRWYTPFGIARSTGAGLADTNVRTAGTLNVRIAPESSSPGFTWDFKILAKANSALYVNGFIQKNAAFGTDDVIVELYLPGLIPGTDTPSDTMTMPDDTSYNVFSLATNYTGTVPRYATVRVTGKTTTASAYCYIADLYNGTNDITNLKTWDSGKPSAIMFEQLGDAAAVWAVATSTLTTSGTVGYLVTKLLTVAKFLGLK